VGDGHDDGADEEADDARAHEPADRADAEKGGITGLLGERSALESLLVGGVESPLPHYLESALESLEALVGVAHRNGIIGISDGLVPPELAFAYWYYDPEEHGIRVNLIWGADALGG
jgi:hypothetical protein